MRWGESAKKKTNRDGAKMLGVLYTTSQSTSLASLEFRWKTFCLGKRHHLQQHTHGDQVTPPKQLQFSRRVALGGMM